MISNVNGHYAPILLLNSERLSFLPNVSDHCSQGNKLTRQSLILLFSGADAPMKPGVVAAAGDSQKSA